MNLALWEDIVMTDQIKAGAEIHAGDGGYSIGTREKYEEFVKVRNRSLGEARIRNLAEQAGGYVSLSYEHDSKLILSGEDIVQKFAELIIRECAELTLDYKNDDYYNGWLDHQAEILTHFGLD